MADTFAGKSALIIGGSSGIGKAVTRQLAQAGVVVRIVGNRAEKLAGAE